MAVYEATTETFDELLDTDFAVVDFYGTFCGPCKMLAPIFEAASEDFLALRFIKVNVDHNKELGDRFGIVGVPTLYFFRNGERVHEAFGYMPREQLNNHIAKMLYGE